MTLAELIHAQAKAGERYAAAIAELHAAFVDLAAIDGALANGNSGHGDYVPTFGPVMAQNAGIFSHPVYAPVDAGFCWLNEATAKRNEIIHKFNRKVRQ
jgi:hypothetical protein